MEANPDPGSLSIFWVVATILMMTVCAFLVAAEQASRGMKEKRTELSGAAVVTTIFSGSLSSFVFVSLTYPGIASVYENVGLAAPRGIAIVTALLVISLLFVVLCVLLPRQIAAKHTEGISRALTGYAGIMSKLCMPFTAIGRGFTSLMLIVLKQGKFDREEEFSEEEVMSMLEAGQEAGALKEEGKKMFGQLFAFDDILAYEIMTPRTDVFCIDIDDEPNEYIDELMQLHYSRIPVYEEESDNIIGILNIKDYMIKVRESGAYDVDIRELLRKAFFVPETKNIDSLFFELQRTKQHIAILIDEYGGFSGIVTMEDIIEEIVGDIDDEYDEEEPGIEKITDTVFYLNGSMDLDDINEETGSKLESEDSETVGGLIIEAMGEIPEDGSDPFDVEYANYRFTVENVKDRRIERVKMEILPEPADDDMEEAEG